MSITSCVQAEEFHRKSHDLLEWLTDNECALRQHATPADDEAALLKQLDAHRKLVAALEEKQAELDACVHMGDVILKKSHPDAVATMKHWISILKSRWQEVSQPWCLSLLTEHIVHCVHVMY